MGGLSTAGEPADGRNGELGQALAASRSQLGLIALLLALTAVAWWSTAERMAGMDAGPGTELGALGWFLGVWVVMMAAMMFPSVAPTVALYATMTRRRGLERPLIFTAGYLIVWGCAGLAAYGLFELGRQITGGALAWHAGGRWFAAAVLVTAAVYELTPIKDVCLSKCRSPVGFLIGSWREGSIGALKMGTKHGAWCLGCCWALMAGLFALGVMSLTWMAMFAALIGLQKLLPSSRGLVWGTSAILIVMAAALLIEPTAVPGLVIPGGMHHSMPAMGTMR